MNEETNISTMPPEDTAPEIDSTSAMEDDWDDIDFSDVRDEDDEGAEQEETPAETEPETPEADQQKEQEGEEQQEEPPAADEPTKETTFDLKYMGEIKTVDRDEVITLAQKGLNYDKILHERDEANGEVSRLKEYESFLDDLAKTAGKTVSDLMDDTRAEVLVAKEGLDKSVALQRVKLDRDRKAFEAEKSRRDADKKAKEAEEKKQSQDIMNFVREFPGVQPQDIPKEVWEKVHKEGMSLVSAYSAYDNKKLRQEIQEWKSKYETAEQNAKNKERSTGSQVSAGVGSTKKKDPIDDDWYSGD